MKDFRERVFDRRPERQDVIEVLKKGYIGKALRKARAAGVVIPQEEIDATARDMFQAGRAGELAAMIQMVDVALPYDANALLVRTFEAGDHHTFLKQTHRLRAHVGLEAQVERAIGIIERRAPQEASGWRRKFGVLRSTLPPATSETDAGEP